MILNLYFCSVFSTKIYDSCLALHFTQTLKQKLQICARKRIFPCKCTILVRTHVFKVRVCSGKEHAEAFEDNFMVHVV